MRIQKAPARDDASGKENRITIKANSGLSDSEIGKMVWEAQAHAAEDHQLRELVDARNQGDALAHITRKALTEYGEKLDAAEKREIEAAIRELEDALKRSDREENKPGSARWRRRRKSSGNACTRTNHRKEAVRAKWPGNTNPRGQARMMM